MRLTRLPAQLASRRQPVRPDRSEPADGAGEGGGALLARRWSLTGAAKASQVPSGAPVLFGHLARCVREELQPARDGVPGVLRDRLEQCRDLAAAALGDDVDETAPRLGEGHADLPPVAAVCAPAHEALAHEPVAQP